MEYKLSRTGRVPVIFDLISNFPETKKLNVAFLGYTDLFQSRAEWEKLIGSEVNSLINRPNHKRLCQIHGVPEDYIIPKISDVLQILYGSRVKADIFDFQTYEGSEIVHDFNFPIANNFYEDYDLVFDFGSSEHIFNFPQAIINLARMCKKNGIVFHSHPLNMINHGFYNISPTLYHDFYSENCFEVVFMRLTGKVRIESNLDKTICLDITDVPSSTRFNLKRIGDSVKLSNLSTSELVVQTIAKKNKSVDEFQFPIQGRYADKTNWT